MGKPHRFLTDALEMFKTTDVASDIADKQIVIDLLRCYYDQRTQAILPEQLGESLWSADTNIGKAFGRMLAGKKGAELARHDSKGFRHAPFRGERGKAQKR